MPHPLNDRPLDRHGEPVITAQVLAVLVNVAWLYLFGEKLEPEVSAAFAIVLQVAAGAISRQLVTPTRNTGMGRSR